MNDLTKQDGGPHGTNGPVGPYGPDYVAPPTPFRQDVFLLFSVHADGDGQHEFGLEGVYARSKTGHEKLMEKLNGDLYLSSREKYRDCDSYKWVVEQMVVEGAEP